MPILISGWDGLDWRSESSNVDESLGEREGGDKQMKMTLILSQERLKLRESSERFVSGDFGQIVTLQMMLSTRTEDHLFEIHAPIICNQVVLTFIARRPGGNQSQRDASRGVLNLLLKLIKSTSLLAWLNDFLCGEFL